MLIELMVRFEPSVNIEMLEKDRTSPCVLSQNQVRFLKDPDRPEGHILEVAHRSGHYVKYARHHLSLRLAAIMKR